MRAGAFLPRERNCFITLAAIALAFWLAPERPARGDEAQELNALNERMLELQAAGNYSEAVPMAKELLTRAERTFKDQPAKLAGVISDVALLYRDRAEYAEAETLYRRALEIRERSLGPEHPDVGASLNDLAVLHYYQGKYAEVEPLLRRAITIREKSLGRDDPAVAASLDNLAALYKEQGRDAEAEPLFQRAIAIQEKSLGLDDPAVAASLNNLALLYHDQGKYARAEPLYRRALKIREKSLGPDHPDVADSLNNLAGLYLDRGRYAEAEPLFQAALKIWEKSRGPDHPDVAHGLNNLAGLYEEQGKYAQAEPLYRRALEIREKSLGLDHPDVARSLNDLAVVKKAQGKYAEAEPLYQRALEIREKRFGPDHADVAESLNGLAALDYEQGKFAEAVQLLQRALKASEKSLGPEHPNVATCLNNLAELYSEQGRYAEAEPLFRRALEIREKIFDPEHPDVAASLNSLAAVYDTQGRYADAEPLYRRALALREMSLGPDHPKTATSLNNLAALYAIQGRFSEAEPLYRRALEIVEKSLGPSHADAALSLNNLAWLYCSQGRFAEAEPLYQRALKINESRLGPDHPTVADSLNNLASLRILQGRYAEAEPLLDRAISLLDRAGVAAGRRLPAYLNRADLAWHQHRRSEAVADLQKAIGLAEEQRTTFAGAEQERSQAFALFAPAFETMIAWQLELNDLPAAFEAMERAQARSLIDQLAAAGTDLLAGLPPAEAAALRERDREAQAKVRYLEQQWTQLEKREDLSEETRAKERNKLLEDLKVARAAAQETYSAIRNASPALRLASTGKEFAPAPLAKVQAWLDSRKALLLRYFSGEEQLYLFVLAPGAPARLVTLSLDAEQARAAGVEPGPITAKKLQALLYVGGTPLTQLLSKPGTVAQATGRLAALWTILVPEDARRLTTRGSLGRLLIVPDGPLALLPFEALVVEPREEPKYLFDLAPPITYGPSATILYNLAERTEAPVAKGVEPVLTVADPDYPSIVSAKPTAAQDNGAELDFSTQTRYVRHGGELGRLPFLGIESQRVVDDFRKSGVAVVKLLRADATEANVRSNVPGREVVHLACHGMVDQSCGNLFGALVLTPGNDAATNPANDGFLTLAEIYDLNLKSCELAILSACETNYGPQQQGEGTWALSRGFLVAGSRRVVASNWLVDDEAAAMLISYFCSAAAQAEKAGGSVDYAAKLHAAKKWIRQQDKWKSPYYWGTFVLVGPN